MTQPQDPTELDTAIRGVYRGPVGDFISRRDALAKQLRADKRRDDADRVKALRKPSRTAWVLDNIVEEDPASLEQLGAAINAAQSGIDLRTALEAIRTAIRNVAAAGARVAIRAGQPIEANALVTALHAVIGDASAFAELRAGRLVDVPEGGGLDILTTLTAIAPSSPAPSSAPPKPEAPPKAEPTAEGVKDAERAIAARADLQRAEMLLRDARERSEHAAQSVRSSEEKLDSAERTLSHAQAEAQSRRADLERARRDAEQAATHLRDAERAAAAARARFADRDG
jgi:hypothetical protein